MRRLLLHLFCFIFLLVGCDKKVEEQIVEAEPDKYTVSIDRFVEIPKDFPTDVYIYPRSNAIEAIKKEKAYSLILSTNHVVPRVTETYKRQMTIKGWSLKAATTSGTETLLAYTKEDRIANVVIGPVKEKIHIRVTVSIE